MGLPLVGSPSGNAAEVDANTHALRVNPRPNDYGSLGIYAKGLTSGTMAAGLAAASSVWQMRYGGSNVLLVKKVLLSAGDTGTAFAAGAITFNLFVARSFSANGSGGTAGTLTGNNGKLRTSMSQAMSTPIADIRISSTAALTAGTWTLDTDPCGGITTSIDATAGRPMVAPGTELLRALPGEYPLVLANNEGLNLQATVPATGTWVFSVSVVVEELSAYS